MSKFIFSFFLLLPLVLQAQLTSLGLSSNKFANHKNGSSEFEITFEQREKLKNPRETMRTFVLSMEKVKRGETEGFADALLTLDLSKVDPGLKKITGRVSAERLINTIDRLAHINYNQIPNYQTGPKWFFRKQTVTVGNNVYDVEIALVQTSEGVWKFSSDTVNTIENFYSSVAHLKVLHGIQEYRNWHTRVKEKMPHWMGEDFLMFKKGQWVGLLVILIISLSLFTLVRFIATQILRLKIRQKSLDLEFDEQFKSTQPFGYLAFSVTWLIGVRQLEFDLDVLQVFSRGSYILTAVFAIWSLLKLVDYITLHFEKMAKKTTNKFDDVLVPMLSKTSKVLVLSFGALLVAHSLTFDIASILAGLGIGGVAVALAAKDTISNLFGSVTVLLDRPFHLGDYVVLEKGLEGSVEEVGFRSTRIRTPINSLVTVPNSVLANMAIDNYGMRKVRRFKTKLSLDSSTSPTLLDEFCEKLRYKLHLNPMVQKEELFVSVYEIGVSSIDISLSLYLHSTTQESELSERHKIIIEIITLAEEMRIKFALPTQSLILHQAP